MRTLALRVERSQASAAVLAERLSTHPRVGGIRFPGLPTDPGHGRARSQMKGFGSVLCLEMAPVEGAVEPPQRRRCRGPDDQGPEAVAAGHFLGRRGVADRTAAAKHTAEPASVPENLVRLSVGIENVEDLWADLEQALAGLGG
ncbi:PLP-dependent transferase [Pseudarthrobacter sp. So.54]